MIHSRSSESLVSVYSDTIYNEFADFTEYTDKSYDGGTDFTDCVPFLDDIVSNHDTDNTGNADALVIDTLIGELAVGHVFVDE